MKQKLFTLFLVLVASMSTAFAHDAEIDGIYYNFKTSFVPPMSFNYTATVTYCGDYSNKYSGSVVIPSSVTYEGKKYSVTNIGSSAFRGCSGLTSVTIPNSVTSIGESTFYNCSRLTNIYIPESVTRISQEAFYLCSRITRIDCMAATPPLVYSQTFSSSIYTKATLNVPEGCADKYKAANIWKEFTNISVLGASTGIKQIDSTASSSCIYKINGTRIGKDYDDINNLKRGIYIIGGKKVYIR